MEEQQEGQEEQQRCHWPFVGAAAAAAAAIEHEEQEQEEKQEANSHWLGGGLMLQAIGHRAK